MSQDYRDKILQSTAEGRKQSIFWQKTLVSVSNLHYNHLFQLAGYPSAGDYTAATAKAATAITGGSTPSPATLFGTINLDDPTSGYDALLTTLKGFNNTVNGLGTLVLVDLLALYRGVDGNTLGAQAMTVTPNPGDLILPRYTNGEGVQILAEVQVALGVTPRAFTVTYTDQGGATGTTPAHTTVASQAASKIIYANSTAGPFMQLAAGDRGVKSIQSAALAVGGTGAGTIALWLCKPLLTIPVVQLSSTAHNYGEARGVDDSSVVEIQSGAALSWVWIPGSTGVAVLQGQVDKVDVIQ
jgi:hypothetical protein